MPSLCNDEPVQPGVVVDDGVVLAPPDAPGDAFLLGQRAHYGTLPPGIAEASPARLCAIIDRHMP